MANSHFNPIPFDVTPIDGHGANRIVEDWKRDANLGRIYIDDIDVRDLLKQHAEEEKKPTLSWSNIERPDLEQFLTKYLLKKLPKNSLAAAINYVMASVHQGGLLHPITANANFYLLEALGPLVMPTSERTSEGCAQERWTCFRTKSTGFEVDETLVQSRLIDSTDSINMMDPTGRGPEVPPVNIVPDEGLPYIYKATATLDVDFSEDAESPKVNQLRGNIQYGQEAVAAQMKLGDPEIEVIGLGDQSRAWPSINNNRYLSYIPFTYLFGLFKAARAVLSTKDDPKKRPTPRG